MEPLHIFHSVRTETNSSIKRFPPHHFKVTMQILQLQDMDNTFLQGGIY